MDPLSIAAGCVALIGAITKTSVLVTGFVRDVRAARGDLDAVSRELSSLRTLLELLADDAADTSAKAFPETLKKQVTGIVANCSGVIADIEETLKKHEGAGLKKSAQWVISGQSDIAKLRYSLEAHKSALEIALDMVAMSLAMEIKVDTQELRNDTAEIKQTIKDDTALILAEIARLQKQLPQEQVHTSGFMLQRYLDNLTSYAETACGTFSDEVDIAVERRNSRESARISSHSPSRSSLDSYLAQQEWESHDGIAETPPSTIATTVSEYTDPGLRVTGPIESTDWRVAGPKLPERHGARGNTSDRLEDEKKNEDAEEPAVTITEQSLTDSLNSTSIPRPAGSILQPPSTKSNSSSAHHDPTKFTTEALPDDPKDLAPGIEARRITHSMSRRPQRREQSSGKSTKNAEPFARDRENLRSNPEAASMSKDRLPIWRTKPAPTEILQVPSIIAPPVSLETVRRTKSPQVPPGVQRKTHNNVDPVSEAAKPNIAPFSKVTMAPATQGSFQAPTEPLLNSSHPTALLPKEKSSFNDRVASRKRSRIRAAKKYDYPDPWIRPSVEPEEIQYLLRCCTVEIKSRALDMPFLLLPFRPSSDVGGARAFIQAFFFSPRFRDAKGIAKEVKMTEPMILISVVKWCWSRLPGGLVGWDAYELFKVGESDSNLARDSFATFIPLCVDSEARVKIIFDFFDLLAAIAAHSLSNGLSGHKLSRMAGWWAFEHSYVDERFEQRYDGWQRAADAASHLFFAYLRTIGPSRPNFVSALPRRLQDLLNESEYPPERSPLLHSAAISVTVVVDIGSPTPLSLLRRQPFSNSINADMPKVLRSFLDFADPCQSLSEMSLDILSRMDHAWENNSTAKQHMHPGKLEKEIEVAFEMNFRTDQPAAECTPEPTLTSGTLSAIKDVNLDDAFQWVWMTSLSDEEPHERKCALGRIIVVQPSTYTSDVKWMIFEEVSTDNPAGGKSVKQDRPDQPWITKDFRKARADTLTKTEKKSFWRRRKDK